MGDNPENEHKEEILTNAEKEKLKSLTCVNPNPVNLATPSFLSVLTGAVSNPFAADQTFARFFGLKRQIVVNNISGKKAWIMLYPAPIFGIGAVGLNKLGNIDFSKIGGDIKCQQSPLLDNTSRNFDLDNNKLYYSVFFECDGKWKIHFKDRKINAKIHDINLLERHIDEAIDCDFSPA